MQDVRQAFLLCMAVAALSGMRSAPQMLEPGEGCQLYPDSVLFECVLFLLPALGPLAQKRGVLKSARLVYSKRSDVHRHLWFHLDAAQGHTLSPVGGIENLVQGYGVEWAGPAHLLYWGQGLGLVVTGTEVVALVSKFWAASGALFEQVPREAAAAPPGSHPRLLGCSCVPRLRLLPGPRPSVKQWCGSVHLAGSGDCSVLVTGAWTVLPPEIWSNSVVLFDFAPTVATTASPGILRRSLGHLCVAHSSLF